MYAQLDVAWQTASTSAFSTIDQQSTIEPYRFEFTEYQKSVYGLTAAQTITLPLVSYGASILLIAVYYVSTAGTLEVGHTDDATGTACTDTLPTGAWSAYPGARASENLVLTSSGGIATIEVIIFGREA